MGWGEEDMATGTGNKLHSLCVRTQRVTGSRSELENLKVPPPCPTLQCRITSWVPRVLTHEPKGDISHLNHSRVMRSIA